MNVSDSYERLQESEQVRPELGLRILTDEELALASGGTLGEGGDNALIPRCGTNC